MAPRSLFDSKHRPEKLVMPACLECNKGTSTSDLTVPMISRWGTNESPQSKAHHSKLSSQFKIQAPELVRQWLSVGPLTIRQLNVFSHKATLALYFEHFKQPLSNLGRVQAMWSTKKDFWHTA